MSADDAQHNPAELYPADPNWVTVGKAISPKEAVLVSLNIDPETIAELENLARADSVDEARPVDLGALQGEYERRMSLIARAIEHKTLPCDRSTSNVQLSVPAFVELASTLEWKLPGWLRKYKPELQQSGEATIDGASPTTAATPVSRPVASRARRAPISTDPKQMLRIDDVAALTGLGRSTVYKRIAGGTFPAPKKDGKVSFWSRAEVVAWIDSKQSG